MRNLSFLTPAQHSDFAFHNITDLIFQNKAREAYACYPRLSTIKQVVWLL